jgi:hypothetical protein
MAGTEADVVLAYFEAWKARDFDKMRSLLDDDLDFVGPLDQFSNADDYHKAIEGLSQAMTDIVVQKTFVDGPNVLTWYDLHTSLAPPAPVADWSRVQNGKISMVRVVFDPRKFTAALQ